MQKINAPNLSHPSTGSPRRYGISTFWCHLRVVLRSTLSRHSFQPAWARDPMFRNRFAGRNHGRCLELLGGAFKHIFWNFHPQFGEEDEAILIKILTFRWVFPHQPGYLLYHIGCNIFPRPRLLTEEAVQELAGQRIQRSFSLKLCQNSHPDVPRTPHNSDMNISNNKIMVPFAEKLFLYNERWVFMDPTDSFSC